MRYGRPEESMGLRQPSWTKHARLPCCRAHSADNPLDFFETARVRPFAD